MPRRRQQGAATTSDLPGHRLDREAAVAAALLAGRDVEPPQTGAQIGVLADSGEVGVEEAHEETDRPAAVPDEARPGDGRVHVRLGEGLHDGIDRVLLVRTHRYRDGGV